MPDEVTFQTKPQLARRMLARALESRVPAAWVAGDEVYGDDGDLRRWLEAQGRPYVLAVSCSHPAWRAGQQARADGLVAALPREAWATLSAGAGSQGDRLYGWACVRLPYESAPGTAHWLLARRSVAEPTEIAYFRAFGPVVTPLEELVRVAGRRWAIEAGFEEAKGTVGLDQYEVRKWNAWHRHITLSMLAHGFLAWQRREAGGKRPTAAPATRSGAAERAGTAPPAHDHLAPPAPLGGRAAGVVGLAPPPSGAGQTQPLQAPPGAARTPSATVGIRWVDSGVAPGQIRSCDGSTLRQEPPP